MTKKTNVSHKRPEADGEMQEKELEKQPNPATKSPRKGEDFGLEGTNKTMPFPQPNAEPTGELQGTKTKFVPKSPYTRG